MLDPGLKSYTSRSDDPKYFRVKGLVLRTFEVLVVQKLMLSPQVHKTKHFSDFLVQHAFFDHLNA